jgi:hypothetical protein
VAEQMGSTADGERLEAAWKWVFLAACASVAVELLSIPVFVSGTTPGLRLPYGLALVGLAFLRALIAYGVRFHARWAAWLGGVLAVVTILSPTTEFDTGSLLFTESVLSAALGWLHAAVDAAFLIGLFLVRRART